MSKCGIGIFDVTLLPDVVNIDNSPPSYFRRPSLSYDRLLVKQPSQCSIRLLSTPWIPLSFHPRLRTQLPDLLYSNPTIPAHIHSPWHLHLHLTCTSQRSHPIQPQFPILLPLKIITLALMPLLRPGLRDRNAISLHQALPALSIQRARGRLGGGFDIVQGDAFDPGTGERGFSAGGGESRGARHGDGVGGGAAVFGGAGEVGAGGFDPPADEDCEGGEAAYYDCCGREGGVSFASFMTRRAFEKGGGHSIPTAPSRLAQRINHVVLTCPVARTLVSRDMTRTMAKTMVMSPTQKTTPTLSFWPVEIWRL